MLHRPTRVILGKNNFEGFETACGATISMDEHQRSGRFPECEACFKIEFEKQQNKVKELQGCGDSGCNIKKSQGMQTTGAKCYCSPEKIERACRAWRLYAEMLEHKLNMLQTNRNKKEEVNCDIKTHHK